MLLFRHSEDYTHKVGCFYGIAMLPETAKLLRRYAREEDPNSVRCSLIINTIRFLLERIRILLEGVMWFVKDRDLSENCEVVEIISGFKALVDGALQNTILIEKFLMDNDFSHFLNIVNVGLKRPM